MWWVMARQSKPFRDRNPVTIGAISLAVIAGLVFLAFNAEKLPFIGGSTVDQIDTTQLADSFEVLSQTFSNTPDEVRSSLQGLARLSQTISSRDDQLKQLLTATRSVTQVLADRSGEFTKLIVDSNTLLQEVQARRQLIDQILTNTQRLSTQLSGLVADNTRALTPALQQLSTVTQVLEQNRDNLGRTVANLAPFVRVFTNTLGNGRWFDSYVENLIPGVLGSALCGTAASTPLPAGCTTSGGNG